ncbi:MAG: LysR substrate-binding domain-containing protein [Silicimonas sp.]|nr:LysR substrate-binding domain-containing protein [Silicimonas sp.]
MIINLPYPTLRAFEAVVRHSGFSAAAEELGISQSAISQHVKSLEEWLGQELLIRGVRKSRPTPEGEELAQAIVEGLGRISNVCAQLRDKQRMDRTIVISCLPGFAFNWLFSRLLHFDIAHPDLSISIATDTGERPFTGANSDIGIRYGQGAFSDLSVDHLMGERLFPVCAPSLLPRLYSVADLAHHTLLVDENLPYGDASPTWDFWARETGQTLPEPLRTRRFGQANMVTQAAIEGLGVALGREPLVIDALREGRLVRPFPQIARSRYGYWLICRPEIRDRPRVQTFLDWIKSEATSQPDLPPPTDWGD